MTQQLLIIGFVWPEPNSSAAGSRIIQLIQLFLEQDWDVTFASAAQHSQYEFDVNQMGIYAKSIVLNDDTFDSFIAELNPSIVLFDRFMTEEQFGWRVAEICPNALRVLDTEDLHCLRLARQIAVKENREFIEKDLFSDVAKREIASILRSDISIIISEFEIELLQRVFHVKEDLLLYLPFLLNPLDEIVIEEWPSFSQRKGFVFIGNFYHEPNKDAVLYLKKEIWPLMKREFPEAVMRIYGAYIPPKIAQLHDTKSKFLIEGRVESAEDVVRLARVVLAPLRFGAGIKGKLAEAMYCGTPSVTTIIGAESMSGTMEWNGFIADSADSFAKKAVFLYENEPVWKEAQQQGIEIYNSRFSKSSFAPGFIMRILDVLDRLNDHRGNNFTGAMLLHHTMTASKYMSKWIESKNKMNS